MSNASGLFRSLIVYGLCLPLAIFLGYLVAQPLDITSISVVLLVVIVLVAPLLLRWHHPWLIAFWNSTAMLFFIPGRPQVWMALAAISLLISVLQFALNRKMKALSVPSVTRPMLFLAAVVLLTARLTGGINMRLLGGDIHGGRNYITLLVGIVGYFAIIYHRIPAKRAGLYVVLFFLGGATMAMANLPGVINPAFNFLFLFFPVADPGVLIHQNSVIAAPTGLISRLFGLSSMGLAVFCLILAIYGIRGVLDWSKLWRLILLCLFVPIALLGGFRSTFLLLVMTFALLFYLEGLHRTRVLVPVLFAFLGIGGLVALFAAQLPFAIQRSLAVVPFIQIDPMVRMDADASTGWRLEVWRDTLPEVPQYLLIGKGYGFSAAEQHELRNQLEGTALVGNYHNGPLSVIIPFGIFGAIGFVWFVVASIRVLYQNYHFGDPALHHINVFLFAYFIAKVIFFFAVFGSFHSDMPLFLGVIALSVSLNGGVAKPVVVPEPQIVFDRFKLRPSAQRPVGVEP